jgi:transposase-like protein
VLRPREHQGLWWTQSFTLVVAIRRHHKDILGLWTGSGGGGAKFWIAVLTDLKSRDVRDAFFVCLHGLKELLEVVGAVWPAAIVQTS